MLSAGRVGKTSILLRYCRDTYDDNQVSTLQASYLEKRLTVDDQRVNLSVWDTAGQERFHALGPIYYRDADAALLVYDITDAASLDKVKQWVTELRKIVGTNISLVIAGNKIDLEKKRQVDQKAAAGFAKSVGASHYHTSAKQNKGLDDAFNDLARQILKQNASKKGKKGGLTFVDAPPEAKKGGCC